MLQHKIAGYCENYLYSFLTLNHVPNHFVFAQKGESDAEK